MTKLILIVFLVFLSNIAFSQSIGLRANYELSEFREMNNSFGYGLYIDIDDFSDKHSVLLFSDFVFSNKEFNNCSEFITSDVNSLYQNFSVGAGFNWIKLINNLKLKIGPSLGYYVINVSQSGQISNWIESKKLKKMGAGINGNIELQEIFNSDFKLDLFISPIYLVHISNDVWSNYFDEVTENLMVNRFGVGVSYKIN
jgi:hypothetical protein